MMRSSLTFLLILLLPTSAFAEDRAAPVEPVIKATGRGYPPPGKSGALAMLMARRAAQVMAQRQLMAKLARWSPEPGDPSWLNGRISGIRYEVARRGVDGPQEMTAVLPLSALVRALYLEVRAQAGLKQELAKGRKELREASRALDQSKQKLGEARAMARQTDARLAERVTEVARLKSQSAQLARELTTAVEAREGLARELARAKRAPEPVAPAEPRGFPLLAVALSALVTALLVGGVGAALVRGPGDRAAPRPRSRRTVAGASRRS